MRLSREQYTEGVRGADRSQPGCLWGGVIMGGTPRSTHGQEARNPETPLSPLPHRRNGRLESVRLAQQREALSEIPAATQMKRRIFGLENEYGLTCTLNGERRLSPDNVARYLFEKVIPGARHANVLLGNGPPPYLDTGF